MHNTYYDQAWKVFEILETTTQSKSFSEEFYDVMFGHCITLLDSGTSHDLIKLYDFMESQGRSTLPTDVVENFK